MQLLSQKAKIKLQRRRWDRIKEDNCHKDQRWETWVRLLVKEKGKLLSNAIDLCLDGIGSRKAIKYRENAKAKKEMKIRSKSLTIAN